MYYITMAFLYRLGPMHWNSIDLALLRYYKTISVHAKQNERHRGGFTHLQQKSSIIINRSRWDTQTYHTDESTTSLKTLSQVFDNIGHDVARIDEVSHELHRLTKPVHGGLKPTHVETWLVECNRLKQIATELEHLNIDIQRIRMLPPPSRTSQIQKLVYLLFIGIFFALSTAANRLFLLLIGPPLYAFVNVTKYEDYRKKMLRECAGCIQRSKVLKTQYSKGMCLLKASVESNKLHNELPHKEAKSH